MQRFKENGTPVFWESLVLTIFYTVFIGQVAVSLWIEGVNLAHLARVGGIVPSAFIGLVDEGGLKRSADYTLATSRLGTTEELASSLVLLGLITSGVLNRLDAWLSATGLHPVAAGICFNLIPALVLYAVSLPWNWYATFVIEERFGFNRSTVATWVKDQVKSGLIALILVSILLAAVFIFIRRFPDTWWIFAYVVIACIQVGLTVLYPILIAPLFNRFEPLKNDALREKIFSLMEANGIRVTKVLQMDAGTRSRHSNAYFTGLGRSKQIVLYDTLIETHTEEEILSVLAHEIGHYRLKHVPKSLALSQASLLVGLFIAARCIHAGWFASAFGFPGDHVAVTVFLLVVFSEKAGFFVQPLFQALSRRFENAADAFAACFLGTAEPLVSALRRLALENLSNLTPHPLYVRFHYSHPPVTERIERLQHLDFTAQCRNFPEASNREEIQ